MTTKHEVLALHSKYPDWSSAEIARALGCRPEYVRATYRRNGLSKPGTNALREKCALIAESFGAYVVAAAIRAEEVVQP